MSARQVLWSLHFGVGVFHEFLLIGKDNEGTNFDLSTGRLAVREMLNDFDLSTGQLSR